MTKIGLLGCGKLGDIIAGALYDGKVPGCQLVGVMGQGMEHASQMAQKYDCTACKNTEELLTLKPDYLIEAATAQALRKCALDVLYAGCSIICLSIGAFEDQAFYNQVAQIAKKHHAKVHLASGVIGGFDIASTLAVMGQLNGTIIKYKYPNDSDCCPPALKVLPDEFQGSAREGFFLSPAHLNIAIAAGLVCGSLDHTQMKVEPIYEAGSPSFGLDLDGEFAAASIRIRQGGFGGAPKGAALAAWSTVATLKRLTSPITF